MTARVERLRTVTTTELTLLELDVRRARKALAAAEQDVTHAAARRALAHVDADEAEFRLHEAEGRVHV